MARELTEIACRIVHETEKAWLIDDGSEARTWIPKSIGEYDYDTKEMTLPLKWAQEAGLI